MEKGLIEERRDVSRSLALDLREQVQRCTFLVLLDEMQRIEMPCLDVRGERPCGGSQRIATPGRRRRSWLGLIVRFLAGLEPGGRDSACDLGRRVGNLGMP